MKMKFLLFASLLIGFSVVKGFAQITILEDIKCNGDTTGAIIANPVNWGTPPYTYLWNNGETSQALHNLGAGNYSVTITDSDIVSPDSVFSILLNEPAAIIITTDAVILSDCDGHNNGGAQISVSGGIVPYVYYWREINFDSVYITQDISNVRGGDYEITITDTWGCKSIDTITIPNNTVVPVTINYQAYICNGALSTVSILADSADSLQYFHYYWSSTYNTGDFITNDSVFSTSTSFLAGNYTITVSDSSNGCANYYNFTVDQSATPMVVTATVVHNTCYGGHAGSISLHVNGGDPLPTYQCIWNGPNGFSSTAFAIGGLLPGDYNYTVTDDGSCSQSGSIRIQPIVPLQGHVVKNDVTCFGGTSGAASAVYTGGQGAIHYLWSNTATTPLITGLAAGTYTLTVTDSLGCTRLDTAIVAQPPQLVITLDSMDNVNCYGYTDGDIWTTTTGGSGFYEYSWLFNGSPYPQITPFIENLAAGNYQLTVTDSLFCTVIQNFVVTQPAQTIFTDSIHLISCNNGADGYWEITPTGIYFPYIAIFSTGDTISTDTVPSPFTSGLGAGTYTCQILASNGCITDFNLNLEQPVQITVGLTNIVPVSCFGDSTGSVTLDNVHGGTAPYSYNWSNGMLTNPATQLPAGVYNVTITDSKNCTLHETYAVEQPYEPIKFFPTIYFASCKQADDGAVAVKPEDIFWSPHFNMFYLYDTAGNFIDTSSNGVPIGNLSPGYYVGVITNNLGCSASNNIYIGEETGDCLLIPNLVTANGDGYNDVFRVQGGCFFDEFQVFIYTDLGKKVFESEDCNFTWDPKDVKASANTVFYYYIKVTDNEQAYEFRNSININY